MFSIATPTSSLGNSLQLCSQDHGENRSHSLCHREEPNSGSRRLVMNLAWEWGEDSMRSNISPNMEWWNTGPSYWPARKKKNKTLYSSKSGNWCRFYLFLLEIHHAHQHIGGSNKSCWIEFDRLLSHYGLPNFHGQRTIFCLWPSRPLLPLLPSLLDWVLTAGKRTKVPPGYPQVQSWII